MYVLNNGISYVISANQMLLFKMFKMLNCPYINSNRREKGEKIYVYLV